MTLVRRDYRVNVAYKDPKVTEVLQASKALKDPVVYRANRDYKVYKDRRVK